MNTFMERTVCIDQVQERSGYLPRWIKKKAAHALLKSANLLAILLASLFFFTSWAASAADVSAPQFTPEGSTSTRYLSVTISCATSGATIRYTTDGSEPTVYSAIYSAPISLGRTTKIHARAWKSGLDPSPIVSGTYVLGKVAVGFGHTLALDLDGSVWAWGHGLNGRLGDGTETSRTVPFKITTLSDIIDVAGGNSQSLAVKADGTLWSWGRNGNGQLGNNTTTDRKTPGAVSGISDARAVAAGANFSLVLRSASGLVYGCGDATLGRLGTGATSGNITTPTTSVKKLSDGSDLTGVVAIAAGRQHSMALDQDGRVWTWGDNTNGRLGDGTTTQRARAVTVLNDETGLPLDNIVVVAAGIAHGLAVDVDGFVWAWGLNTGGQLGDGTTVQKLRAIRMKLDASTLFEDAVNVAGGDNFTLVTKADGTLWACGANTDGSLGIGSTTGQLYLKQVISNGQPLTNVASASAGTTYGLALGTNGEIFTWGNASDGHLGNGTSSPNVTSAQQLTGLKLGNKAPSISLTASGSTSAPSTNVELTATVSDPEGNALRVDFYLGEVLIGSKTASPYTVTLASGGISELGVGRYGFMAEVIDSYGASTQATAIHTVNPPEVAPKQVFFRRGLGTDPRNYSTVVALDFERGKALEPIGFTPANFPNGMPWFTSIGFPLAQQFGGWGSSPGTYYYLNFANPIIAFGSAAGGSPLYKNRSYRIGTQFGALPKDSSGNYLSFPQFQINVFRKDTGALVGTKIFSLPIMGNPADTAKWESFVRNGYSWPTPEYPDAAFFGLDTKLQIVNLNNGGAWGIEYPGYIFTHESSSDEYGYVISGQGAVPIPATSPVQFIGMAWTGGNPFNATFMPLYTLDFDTRSNWQSEILDRPSFQGQPMPSQYLGKSLQELIGEQARLDISLAIDPNSYKTVNQSPELRRHSTLDTLATDLTNGLAGTSEKVLAISNFVLNEIELSEPLGYNEGGNIASASINPGGVQRGAYATYMEGQGAPHEQCALLVYLLRQAGVPATYLYPQQDKLLMLDARLSTMLGFQIKGLLDPVGNSMPTYDPKRPSLIPVNYPWVAAYVDGQWVHIFPWLKDVEVEEGYDLYSLMPAGYKNAHQWIAKYLACDSQIENLISDNDTPAVLFPKFIEKTLSDNHPGLSIDDVGVRIHQRKNYYTSLGSLPKPFALTGTPTVVESLKNKANIFDTIKLGVAAIKGDGTSDRGFVTAEMPLLELFNRKLLIYQTKYNDTRTNVRLILSPFDKGITGTGTFDGTLANMGKRQEKLMDPRLRNTTEDQFLKIQFSLKRQRSFTPPSGMDQWSTYMGFSTSQLIEHAAVLGKGDLAGLCINYGRVTARMLDVHAQEFWSKQGSSNTDPEIYAGTPVYLMGMSYYKRLSDFNPVNFKLHKALMLNNLGVGLSVMGAERNANGNLPSGNITLKQPHVDMFINQASSVGNNTLHPESGEESALGARLNASAMYITNVSAQEHAVIDQFYSKSDSISTVKLLRMAKKDPVNYPQGYFILNKSNYMAKDAAMSALDSGMWNTIKERFLTGEGNYLTVYITSKKVTGAAGEYSGMGALILGLNEFNALISKNLNGGYASSVPTNTFSLSNSSKLNLSLTNTSSYNSYTLNSIPSFTSTVSVPFTLAQAIVSYGSTYDVWKQAGYGTYSVSPSMQSYVSTVDASLGLGLSSYNTSASYGAAFSASKNQGSLGIGSFFGSVVNWVADPVNVMTGAFYHDETDLSLPGPMPLQIRRSYSSRDLVDSEIGYGWKISLVPYLVMPVKQGTADSDPVSNPTNDIYAAEMDGSVIVYTRVGATNTWVPTLEKNPQLANIWGEAIGSGANVRNAKIVRTGTTLGDTVYTLTSADGSVRVFKIKSYPIPGTLPSGVTRINRKRAYLDTWSDNRGNSFIFTFGEDNTRPDYGLLKRVSSSNGMFIGFNYDSFGHITEGYTSDGRWVYYGYNQYGDLESITRPDGSIFKYEYKLESAVVNSKTEWTSTHLISRETRPEGRVLENDYDSIGRVTTQRATVGDGNALVVNGKFTYSNTENGDKTLTGYTLVEDAYDRAIRYDYAGSQITKVTDPLNQETTYEWYGATETTGGAYPRSLKKVTDPRGLQKTFTYDAAGNLASTAVIGDLTGDGSTVTATTSTTYNARNLPLEVTDPVGNRTVYTYDDTAQPYLPTSIERFASSTSINKTLRQYGNTGSGAITAKGVLLQETSASGTGDAAVVEYTYDARGYPTRTTRRTGTDDPDVVTYSHYNLRGELVEVSDVLGRKTAYSYDAMGHRIWEERLDETGTLLWWNYTYYNGNGEVTWTDGPRYGPEDYTWRRYDGGGRLIEETKWLAQAKADGSGLESPEGLNAVASTFNQYNAFGDLLHTVDPRGFATTMTYDDIGQLTQKKRLAGSGTSSAVVSSESFTYEPGGEIETHTNPLGGVTQNFYTDTGRLKRQERPDGTVSEVRYQLDGRVIKEIQPDGTSWNTAYNDATRTITRTLKDSGGTAQATETQKYDRRGNLIETTDAEGNVFTKTYDALNRVTQETGPAATASEAQRRTVYRYDAAGKKEVTINALNESTVTTKDALGRPVLVEIKDDSSATVSQTSYRYRADHHGTIVTTGSGTGSVWSYIFTDNENREVLVSHADDKFRLKRYDKGGNLLSSQDELSRVTTVTYDALGRPILEQRPGGEEIDFAYDAAGNLTERLLPDGPAWKATYDNASRKLTEKLQSGSSESRNYTYTYLTSGAGIGQLGTVSDPRGITKTYSYDFRARLEGVTTTGTSAESNQTLQYLYNKRNELLSVEQSGGAQLGSVVTLTRGAYGGIVSEAVTLDGSAHSTYDQSWNAAGRRIKLEPQGQPTKAQTFTWRADGLLIGTGIGSTSFTYTYGNQGLLVSSVGANSTRTIANRDNRGRATSITTKIGAVTNLTEALTWRADSTLTSYDATRSGTGAWNETRAYQYDAGGRLTVEPYAHATSSISQLEYAFNNDIPGGLGVRTLADLTGVQSGQWEVPSGKVNAFGRIEEETATGLLGSGTKTSSYDAAGNVTGRDLPGGKTQTLKWDGLGRLVKVEERDASADGYNWSANYDGLGRRLKTVYQPVIAGAESGAATEVASAFDPQVEFLELETRQGSNTWRKLYGPDGEGQYGDQQGVGGLEAVIASSGTGSVPVIDYYGNVAGWVSGTTVDFSTATRSLAYGPAPGVTPTVFELNPASYTPALAWQGRRIDPTGMICMGARYYEPESGRFISTDPMGHAASLSLYDYANGDPVNGLDPDGRIAKGIRNGLTGGSSSAYDSGAKNFGYNVGSLTNAYYSGLWQGTQNVSGYTSYTQHLSLFEGDRYAAANAAWNPAYMALRGSYEAGSGMGLQPHNLGFDLSAGQRVWSGVEGALGATATVSAGFGISNTATRLGITPALENFVTKGSGGSLTQFIYDSRQFTKISSEYWAVRGPADGRSLHHWLIPQRASWVPQGIRNAGFNLVELPAMQGTFHRSLGLNQWMGFARNWGPGAKFQATLVENSIRIGIPAAGAATGYLGYQTGNAIYDSVSEKK